MWGQEPSTFKGRGMSTVGVRVEESRKHPCPGGAPVLLAPWRVLWPVAHEASELKERSGVPHSAAPCHR